MHHLLFGDTPTYKVAFLTKPQTLRLAEMRRYYVDPLAVLGVPNNDCIGFSLRYDAGGKAPVGLIKSYLIDELLPALERLKTQYLFVNDGAYFKVLTKEKKADVHMGYVLPCAIAGYEHMQVVLGYNYQGLIFDPTQQTKLDMGLKCLADHIHGNYVKLGADVIKYEYYPQTLGEIEQTLQSLHQYPALTADIEGFSLKFDEAGVGTISFAWNMFEGISFKVDWEALPEMNEQKHYGQQVFNAPVRALLVKFFEEYQGEMTWHNAGYDVKVLVYQLFMTHPLDYEGMLRGIDLMAERMHDTKLIAYLATNTTAGNVLGLKALAHEFAGNYAVEDIKDIRLIPEEQLLRYNLVDALSTWFVRDKYYPVMVADNQEALYLGLFRDSQKMLIQTELVGMPMDDEQILAGEAQLIQAKEGYLATMMAHPIMAKMNAYVQTKAMTDANAKLKTKQHPLTVFSDPASKHYKSFNPNSNPQLQVLLYELMGLPIIELTDTKQPATGADVIETLSGHILATPFKDVLLALIDYSKVAKILSSFLPAFKSGKLKADGMRWLHGSLNLGGTLSGRLSSSDPNLQNMPASSTYGKLVKAMFKAPKGWLMGGADFNSLEDMISALTTKDPNKLKVYTDGFDGHSLRAAFYFKEQLEAEGIFLDHSDPKSVNRLKKEDHPLRQDSKPPTFLLTYGGTYHGMMKNLGWTQEKSQRIEANYHSLYKVSDEYIARRIKQACTDGYVEVAFGLRVRTPLLGQSVLGNRSTTYQAQAEGRTAGNAMGQSYGLLNNRAAVAFFKEVWASPYRHKILPICLIHDAIYILMRDDIDVVEWANRKLIEAMQWQELPELYHPTVKLGAALDLFYPSWAKPLTLPNKATTDQIRGLCRDHLNPPQKKAA
jgi:DNA polymerase-1